MIPVSPVQRENHILAPSLVAAVEEVIESGELILGRHGKRFEEAWASETDSDHCVGLASGLDALEAALRAVGVMPGDTVVVPAISAAATALAPVRLGARPLFADVDPATGLLDMAAVLDQCDNMRLGAAIPVALFGLRPNSASMRLLENELGVPVVMDMAQAHGSLDENGNVDVPGQASAWSFYPTKNLGAIGDAGALTTNIADVAGRARRWRNYGQRARYDHIDTGVNSRLDDVQASVLTVKMQFLADWTTTRRETARIYLSAIDNGQLRCLVEPESVDRHALHQFVVVPDDRLEFVEFLESRGIGTDVHYPKALPDQPAFRSRGVLAGGSPNARALADHAVSIPVHPFLQQTEVEQIATALSDWCAR